ncbi:hypothetical protein AM587_10003894 [Phytophthora nicotianae]|uniref:Uncharacterized protein n=1 Tax=Phytophthora nicotianae TaxID=4792 RepID=A0A0W8CK16_PHYNI|nr:hypothetical protein AM587_10003894 [Phytophthora nicotianae]
MAIRKTIEELPADAIPCDGPLMYHQDKHVSPDGRLFTVHPTTGTIEVATPTDNHQYYAWCNAKQRLSNGSIIDMDKITGFYRLNKGDGRVLIRALVAYYFVERLSDPDGMRAHLIDSNEPISPGNLRWVTADEQTRLRMNKLRSKVGTNKSSDKEDIDLTAYKEFHGYVVKTDGTEVIKHTKRNGFKNIAIRVGSDGYHNVTLTINRQQKCYRLNRLIAMIHHSESKELSSDIVIDHIDGNILNNAFSNLTIVDHVENVRRGNSATNFIKVDPSSMLIQY